MFHNEKMWDNYFYVGCFNILKFMSIYHAFILIAHTIARVNGKII